VYFAAVLVIVGGMLLISYLLGQRHRDPATGLPYESGVPTTGSARLRFDVQFYLNAVFFVIFDLETAFVFAWAVSVRELGWPGFVAMAIFIGFLLIALLYLWRLGALDWRTARRARIPQRREPR
jgi:NADH-quinone oxidoreductase subunit A